MKVLSILGTSSNSGKSWMTTAICAWLRRQGYRVAPFKAQNMSNNSYVTFEGHEIGRAQAAQAEACGLRPISAMNPILLKPSGKLGSQLIIQGKAEGHLKATEYYQQTDRLWKVVTKTLEEWKSQTDVLVMEGAGSPVELNLLHRDIVNLRPVHHTDGRWILVSDIERGGVFAQIVGTWQLLNEADRARGLGVIVNKFRGDLSLFSDIEKHLLPHTTLPYLGVLPFDPELQPESEDSLCQQAEEKEGDLWMAWIRFPHLSNSQDAQPWKFDSGIGLRWVDSLQRLEGASMIVLPGSKNTIADLEWLRKMGLDRAIIEAAKRGIPVIGICGGYQILGETLRDPAGIAGDSGEIQGLGLLPIQTTFHSEKEITQVKARWEDETWNAYEIHMGKSVIHPNVSPLLSCRTPPGEWRPEGCRRGNVGGTYLHGIFESAKFRQKMAQEAGISSHQISAQSWREKLDEIYGGMANLIEQHLNLEPIRSYVER